MSSKHPKRKDRPGADHYGRSPLHYAAADGDVSLARQLLSDGVAPDAADDEGWTPLHFAAQNNAVDIVKLLLEAGVPVDPRDSHGNTPLFRAVFNSRGQGDVIELLRSRGADPHVENNHGVSPLKLAWTIGNYDVQQFFRDLSEESA